MIPKKDNIINQLTDTIIHKKLVLDSCFIMSGYLCSNDQNDLALELLKRASTHDMSKFDKKELINLSSLPSNKGAFKDPNSEMSEEEIDLIKLHWKHNSHHPEYFENYEDMSELDMLEMICDWHARSVQFNTNFLEFVRTRQENRFHFNKNQFNYIYEYCEKLDKLYKESINK